VRDVFEKRKEERKVCTLNVSTLNCIFFCLARTHRKKKAKRIKIRYKRDEFCDDVFLVFAAERFFDDRHPFVCFVVFFARRRTRTFDTSKEYYSYYSEYCSFSWKKKEFDGGGFVCFFQSSSSSSSDARKKRLSEEEEERERDKCGGEGFTRDQRREECSLFEEKSGWFENNDRRKKLFFGARRTTNDERRGRRRGRGDV